MANKATVSPDVDALASEPDTITLSTGSEVHVERLKTRQMFKLLKIVTVGAGSIIGEMSFSPDAEPEEFAGQLIGLLLSSIPEAEDEAIAFIQSMVSPVGLIDRPRSKPEREVNNGLYEELEAELENPEIEDVLSIMEKIIQNEADNIQSLGKRLAAMFKMNVAREQVNSSSKKNSEALTPEA